MSPRTTTTHRRPIAYSSQHIIATTTHQPGTIQLRFITIPNRPTPTTEFKLPTHSPPSQIDQLLFSPDGTKLLVISSKPHLRLVILNQSESKADRWKLEWDYQLQTNSTIKALTFINQTRRSFVEPIYHTHHQQNQNSILIGTNHYHQLRRTTPSAINSFAHGKGQTAILVFNTNQLFIIHLPPPGSNLPPHTLLTNLDHPIDSVKLNPTPSSTPSTHQHDNPAPIDKQIRIASIGLPPSRPTSSPNQPENQPSLLIAFQSHIRPAVPVPIKHETLIPTDHAPKAPPDFSRHQGGSTFPIGEEELDDYITGIGDLDDAFDRPSTQTQPNHPLNNTDHSQTKTPTNDQPADQQPKPSPEPQKHLLNLTLRRFEPLPPPDHSSSLILDNLPHQPTFGFIDLVELSIDFDHSIIPNVTVHLIPCLPITDPFDHATDSQVILRHLSFVNCTSNGPSDTPVDDALRLVATFSREEASEGREDGTRTLIEQVQAWDVRFQFTNLSTGFLSLESFNDFRNQSLAIPDPSSPADLLRGPAEWVFNRVAHRKLLIHQEPSSAEPIVHPSSGPIRVCKLIPEWRVRVGCFLLFVEKTKHPIQVLAHQEGLGAGDDDEQREGEEDTEHECWVLDGQDLSTVAVKPLPRLDEGELEQAILSYHGIWCCTLDRLGKVRASPLVSADDSATIVGLIVSALHNREPVDDISRLLGFSSSRTLKTASSTNGKPSTDSIGPVHHNIFCDIGLFITHFYTPCRVFDLDPYLSTSWSLAYDLWSVIQGYEPAAEIALIGRHLVAVLGIGTMVKADNYSGSVWQMIGLSRWYLRLCQRIIGSIDSDSETPHLCLVAMSGCSFYFLFKVAMMVSAFNSWLKLAGSYSMTPIMGAHSLHPHQRRHSQSAHPSSNPLVENFPPAAPEDQVEIAKVVFAELWDHENFIHMETFGKLLQDIGRTMFPKQAVDLSTVAPRHTQGFTLAMTALDPALVQQSVRELREHVSRHPTLIKPGPPPSCPEVVLNVAPASTVDPTTPPQRPSTTPTASPPASLPPPSATIPPPPSACTSGAPWLSSSSTISTLKKINRTIRPCDDLLKYDLLTGVKLADVIRTHKRTREGTYKNRLSGGAGGGEELGVIKECVKCRARALVLPWSYNDLLAPSSPLTSSSFNPPSFFNRLAQFDFSVREFRSRCFCAGLWVSPSSLSYQ